MAMGNEFNAAAEQGRYDVCLNILSHRQVPWPDMVAALKKSWSERAAGPALEFFRRLETRAERNGRVLPPPLLRMGIEIHLAAGQKDGALRLVGLAKRNHPADAAEWALLEIGVAGDAAPDEIKRSAQAFDWRDARDALDRFLARPGRDDVAALLLSTDVQDWIGVLEAEATLVASRGQEAVQSAAVVQAGFDARMALGLANEALDLVRGGLRRLPASTPLALREARALLALGQPEAACARLTEMRESGRRVPVKLFANALIAMDALDACDGYLDELERIDAAAARGAVAEARARLWVARDQPQRGLEVLLQAKSETPEDQFCLLIGRFAAATRDTERLDALVAQALGWGEDAGKQSLFLKVGPMLVHQHYRCLLNWGAVAALAEALRSHVLAPSQATTLASAALIQGENALAEETLRRTLTCFPRSPSVLAQLMAALRSRGDVSGADDVRARMALVLPTDICLAEIERLPPANWSASDVRLLLSRHLEPNREATLGAFVTALGRCEALGPGELERMITEDSETRTLTQSMQLQRLVSRAGDRKLLEDAVLQPIDFTVFEERAGRLAGQLSGAMEDPTARSDGDLVLTAECFAHAVALARELLQRITNGAPCSVVRIGDGAPDPEMTADHLAAVDAADIVGAPKTHDHLAARSGSKAMITSPTYADDLGAWNLWRVILTAVTTVSWIAGRDLTDALLRNFGVATRQAISTQSERHDAVRVAISPQAGEVYLVSAGPLGAIYCDVVRQKGGVAIDISGLAESLAGQGARRRHLSDAIGVNLTNTLVFGHGLTVKDERKRVVGPAGLPHSTDDGRLNIGGALAIVTRRRRTLKVIGHPRCASAFMAVALSAHGLEIGHERLLRDGISSWLHVVQDATIPYGDNASIDVDFDHTLVHARDPFEAIPSIMIENGVPISFDFRRQHILRETGVDIAAYGSALDRAAASLVLWYEIAMTQKPDAVIRVEDAETAIPTFLNAIGRHVTLSPTITLAAQQSSRSEDVLPDIALDGEEDAGAGGAQFNSTQRKFLRSKPRLSPDDLAAMDGDLKRRLAEYCGMFDYASPQER